MIICHVCIFYFSNLVYFHKQILLKTLNYIGNVVNLFIVSSKLVTIFMKMHKFAQKVCIVSTFIYIVKNYIDKHAIHIFKCV